MSRHARWEPPRPVIRDHRAPPGGILLLNPRAVVRHDLETGETTDGLEAIFGDRSSVIPGCGCDYCTWERSDDPFLDHEAPA